MASHYFLSRIQVPGTVARDCAFISQASGGQLWEKEIKRVCASSKYDIAGLGFSVRPFPRILSYIAACRK